MTSKLCLYFAGVFLSYALQVAAGYAACRLLVRLLPSPRQRFSLWMSFLLAAGTYWVSLVYRGILALSGTGLPTDTTQVDGAALSSGFVLPLAWSRPIQLATEALGLIYALVVLILLGRLVWRHLQLRSFLRNGVCASDELTALFEVRRRALGVGFCQLLVLPNLASPATAGWWRPRILLPYVCEEIGPAPQVEDALSHELQHVVRCDYLWASLADFICRLLFFHPVVWFARELMRLEGELSCDLAMIESRPERCADYADSLTFFARLGMLQEQAPVGIDFAGSASSLGRRVGFILDASPGRPRLKRVSRTMLGLAIVCGFTVVAPALTIFLDFERPSAHDLRTQGAVPVAGYRSNRPGQRHQTPVQRLVSVPRQTSVPETPIYQMSSTNPESGSVPADDLRPPWPESSPSVRRPSFPDVVRSTVGSIILGRGRDHDDGRDRGRDRHIVANQ